MPATYPGMKSIIAKFWNQRQQFARVVMHGLAGQDPAHVGPETAVMGRMRVSLSIRVPWMETMRGHPEYRAAFQGQRPANRQAIFDPLGGFVPPMRQQAVVSH